MAEDENAATVTKGTGIMRGYAQRSNGSSVGVGSQRTAPQESGLELTIFNGKDKVAVIDLSRQAKSHLDFGRALDNDIVVGPDNLIVSRHHGSLFFENGTWVVRDYASKNGIRKNGVRVLSAPVEPGDIISIGKLQNIEQRVLLAFGNKGSTWDVATFTSIVLSHAKIVTESGSGNYQTRCIPEIQRMRLFL